MPEGFTCPVDRIKPWGTGHAILSSRNLINEPFVVINGDDFYGLESFQVIAKYYRDNGKNFSMVAFQLDKTLSEFGGVSRGICVVKNQFLDKVTEIDNIKRAKTGISSDSEYNFQGMEPVSMNMWGFTPSLFSHLNDMFINFLKVEGHSLKSEFLIPTVVNHLIQSQKEELVREVVRQTIQKRKLDELYGRNQDR